MVISGWTIVAMTRWPTASTSQPGGHHLSTLSHITIITTTTRYSAVVSSTAVTVACIDSCSIGHFPKSSELLLIERVLVLQYRVTVIISVVNYFVRWRCWYAVGVCLCFCLFCFYLGGVVCA